MKESTFRSERAALHVFLEVGSAGVVHHDVDVAHVLERVVGLDEVRVVDLGQDHDFSLDVLQLLFLDHLEAVVGLDGHPLVRQAVLRLPHHREGSFSEDLPLELVVAELLVLLVRKGRGLQLLLGVGAAFGYLLGGLNELGGLGNRLGSTRLLSLGEVEALDLLLLDGGGVVFAGRHLSLAFLEGFGLVVVEEELLVDVVRGPVEVPAVVLGDEVGVFLVLRLLCSRLVGLLLLQLGLADGRP